MLINHLHLTLSQVHDGAAFQVERVRVGLQPILLMYVTKYDDLSYPCLSAMKDISSLDV